MPLLKAAWETDRHALRYASRVWSTGCRFCKPPGGKPGTADRADPGQPIRHLITFAGAAGKQQLSFWRNGYRNVRVKGVLRQAVIVLPTDVGRYCYCYSRQGRRSEVGWQTWHARYRAGVARFLVAVVYCGWPCSIALAHLDAVRYLPNLRRAARSTITRGGHLLASLVLP